MPYCQHCGAKLEDGQTCTCEMAQAAVNQPSQSENPQVHQAVSQSAPQAENQVSTLFKKIKQYLSAYFANPAQATHSVMEAEYEPAVPIILAVIRLLSLGLALYGFLNKACKDALDLITKTLFRYSSSAEILTAKLFPSLPMCLIIGALIAVICMFLFILMLFALVRIQHGTTSFSTIFKASAANGLPTTALLLLAFLCSFASFTICMIFVALSLLSWIISGLRTAQLVCPDSSSGTFALMYFVGVVLIIIVSYWIIPSLFFNAVGSITANYKGESVILKDIFDEAKKSMTQQNVGNFKEMWDEALGELITQFWHIMY